MPFDDLTFAPEPGWGELMRLARAFPLESFSFVGPAPAAPAHARVSQQISYDAVHQMVDGAGDGPLIGLGSEPTRLHA
jgi:hypothetical protein